jgi:lipopolysaccharide transport system ATP-binding protein
MREVASSGRTVIFVSHNQASIASLCTRALWLEHGRTRMDGPVDEVASQYLASVAAHDDGLIGDRADRSGSGALRFTRAEVFDGSGNPTRTLVAGDEAVLALSYSASTRLRSVEVMLFIDSSLGERVVTFSNELTGDELFELPNEGTILCRLDRLPLNGGDYSCSLKAKVNGDAADQISDAVSFTVDATRFYPTRRHPSAQSGPLLIEGGWRLEDSNTG